MIFDLLLLARCFLARKTDTGILNHFENLSNAFDNIYRSRQASFLYKLIDILFRKSILERRRKKILSFSGDVRNKDILDIGCGSGRYSVLLAKAGPNFVLGLDISASMIKLAEDLAKVNNVADICKFENYDFLQKEFNDKFDIIIAAGIFDYTPDPKIFLLKIRSILKEKAVLSFPVKWTLFTPLRMAWLLKRGCCNYYYTKRQIKNLLKECGFKVDTICKIGSFLVPGNYIAVCNS